jgi:hypothetical protein
MMVSPGWVREIIHKNSLAMVIVPSQGRMLKADS